MLPLSASKSPFVKMMGPAWAIDGAERMVTTITSQTVRGIVNVSSS